MHSFESASILLGKTPVPYLDRALTKCGNKTVISREYSSEWKLGDEPYYPVNDEKNGALYEKYKEMGTKEKRVIFGGRLGKYKYYDMDQVIAAALERAKTLK